MKTDAVRSNIYKLSQNSIDDYSNFPWHRGSDKQIDTDRTQSSQAVMIDVFGLLKLSIHKDEIINSVFNVKGSNWNVLFEYTNRLLLNELTPTQIDVLLESNSEIIIVECKFTETDGGECSQKEKIRNGINIGLMQCNGNYQDQINPVNNQKAKCALSAKGIKYWDYIEQIYSFDKEGNYIPCPFARSHYQWMRNLCTAEALASLKNKTSTCYICYYDSVICKMKTKFDTGYLKVINENILAGKNVKLITYNELIEKAIRFSSEEVNNWKELKEWLNTKVEKIRRTTNST